MKIVAFAGTGKTSTLQFLAEKRVQRGLYLAFNRAIAAEAKAKFPTHVDCRTTHSIAAQYVRNLHQYTRGKLFDLINAHQLAEILKFEARSFNEKSELTPVQQAHLVMQAVRTFCNSASDNLTEKHVDLTGRLRMLSKDAQLEAVNWVTMQSQSVWQRMRDPNDPIPLGHDGYLKVWSLSKPTLEYSFIFVDEAQDTNPAVLSVLSHQSTAQMVYVGDSHQQIYEWRGAIDAMSSMNTKHASVLTQSFRFGPSLADAASKILRTLSEKNIVRGSPSINTAIVGPTMTRAILARTNGTVIAETLKALEAGRKPHIVGGTDELRALLRDVDSLMKGEAGQRPEFFGFKNWQEVVAFANTDEGEQIKQFVNLVQTKGPGRLWTTVINATENETKADVVISTAHKAKGREWTSVRVADDFAACKFPDNRIPAAEARLFYVTITRAKEMLSVDPILLNAFCTGRADELKRITKPSPTSGQPARAPRAAAPAQHTKSSSATSEIPETKVSVAQTISENQNAPSVTQPSSNTKKQPEPNAESARQQLRNLKLVVKDEPKRSSFFSRLFRRS